MQFSQQKSNYLKVLPIEVNKIVYIPNTMQKFKG